MFSKQIKNRFYHFFSLKNITLVIIVTGVILRLIQYLLNRSLWLDESVLALNIVNKSFMELIGPLDYSQVAPIGFLFISKALVILLGNSEYVLRLFPLLSGIISLFLFYHVARNCIQEAGALVAVGLFSLSGILIYYSSELKQYSSDITITLLLLVFTLYIRSRRLTNVTAGFFTAIGAIAVWFSLPSVFVLAGIGCTLSSFSVVRKEWGTNNKLLITYFIWLLSFGVFYLIYSRNISLNFDNQQFFWKDRFMPFPPMSISDFKWFGKNFFKIFSKPVGMYLPGLGAMAFLFGCVSIFSKDRQLFFILLSPVFVTLFASAFQIYPFHGRLLLFMTPLILLFIGEGVAFLCEITRDYYRRIVWIILVGLLFCGPLMGALTHAISRTGYNIKPNEDIKPVMEYIKQHRKQGDILYVYFFSTFPFRYYSERYGFSNDDYIEGIQLLRPSEQRNRATPNRKKYLDDLKKIKGNKRVWLIFSHTYNSLTQSDDEMFYLYHLDKLGKRLDTYKSVGASVYLYDLSKKHESLKNKIKRDRQPGT